MVVKAPRPFQLICRSSTRIMTRATSSILSSSTNVQPKGVIDVLGVPDTAVPAQGVVGPNDHGPTHVVSEPLLPCHFEYLTADQGG